MFAVGDLCIGRFGADFWRLYSSHRELSNVNLQNLSIHPGAFLAKGSQLAVSHFRKVIILCL